MEFRRGVPADPRHVDGKALEFEHQMEGALRVPVPPGLEEMALEGTRHRGRLRWHAIAAAVVLAAGLAALLLLKRDDPLALAGIEFVVYEEAQAIAEAKPVDASVLQSMVPLERGALAIVADSPRSLARVETLLGARL